MSNFTTVNNDKVYELDEITGDSREWTVIQQESYKLSKPDLILSKFKQEFEFDIIDYKELTDVCSRSQYFTNWLINANLLYSDEAQLPLFLKDLVEPLEFKNIQKDLSSISGKYSTYSIEKRKITEKYKKEIKLIDQKQLKEVLEIKGKNKILEILSMDSSYLPFSLQLMINRYVPSNDEISQESQQTYGREVLIKYKKLLCTMVKDEPSIDITAVIEANKLK